MFRQHYEKMYNLVRSILSDDDESKDVVSEVFTTILADDVVLMLESEEGFLMRSVRNRCLNLIAHTCVKERVTKLLLDDAPFSGSGLTSWGNGERICSVFLTQVIGHQQILFSYVNGNAPFSVRFRYSSHLSHNR